jgi:diguanylate cyclase|tara:strand:+ start:36947 stop:37966 length:1020 start_codon:yes stop_codon:yes gene_type:complete
MLHPEEPKQAAEYLRQLIPMLSQQNLAPTPVNYAVFYSYLSGSSRALNEVIDNTISEKKGFTLVKMLELYEKYVNGSVTIEQQNKIQQALEKVMSEATDEIAHVNNEACGYDAALHKHTEALSSSNDPQAASLIMQQILQDTREMVKSNLEMQARMQEANADIAKMKLEIEAVKETSEKDALSGLYNRSAFDKKVASLIDTKELAKASLVMIDIDHFKRINDNFGHLIGDRVIRYVSALLKQIVGNEHHISRFGGEEFAIILLNQPLTDVVQLVDKVRAAMGNSKLQRKGSGETIGKVTLSAGVTALKAGDSIESFIDRADQALYGAKETGRNKVSVSK